MRILKVDACKEVSGGLGTQQTLLVSSIAFVAGGTASAYVAGALGPLATVIGTPAAAIGLGAVCTLPAPVVGTICCGFIGAVGGYYLSSTFATAGGFLIGGAVSAAATLYKLKN